MGTAATAIPQQIKAHLAAHRGSYKVRICQSDVSVGVPGIPPAALARAQLLQVDGVSLLVVHPANRRPDLQRLSQLLRRRVEPSPFEAVKAQFPDCEPSLLPPFGAPYGVRTLVDVALDSVDEIYFPPGVRNCLVRASREDFRRLTEGALRGPFTLLDEPRGAETLLMRQRVEAVKQLPPMPGIAQEIVRLRDNPYSNANELAAVIEQDPSLSAQLLHYARSPFYGYVGRLETVEQAIIHVLGTDFVMDLAFGLALGKPFRQPRQGAQGLEAFWRHAIYCASLSHALCGRMEFNRRPSVGLAYLSGLLHNFGTLLLGHLFPSRHARLGSALRKAEGKTVIEVEREVIGVTHPQLGAWLMESWGLHQEIRDVVEHHHEPHFTGDFFEYVRLVQLGNRLLKRLGMGDAESSELPPAMLRELGLSEAQAEEALAFVLRGRNGLDFMARKMVA